MFHEEGKREEKSTKFIWERITQVCFVTSVGVADGDVIIVHPTPVSLGA